MGIQVKTATSPLTGEKPFQILYDLPKGTNVVVCIGGRGGMKTYEVSKFIAFSSTVRKKRCVVLRDEKELIRESILNEVLLRFDTANTGGRLSAEFDRLDTGIKHRQSNEMLVFTKGFRASQVDKKANLKSISNVDIAVIEEAEDIRDVDKFNTFADSIRKEDSLVIIILNTPDVNHWIIKRYFNLVQVEDGFYEIVPKDLPGFVCIKTGFEDNPFLPEHIVKQYRAYGDPTSHLFNPFYYRTAIKGLASTGRKGQVFTKVKPIKLVDYLALPFKEYYGLDFGTASPAGIVGVKVDKNAVYARQLNYKPMVTLEIAKFFCTLGLNLTDLIVADSADPKSIAKLKKGYTADDLSIDEFVKYPALARGFHIVPAKKGADSVEYSIGVLDSMEFYVVEESVDFWNEVFCYIYAQDKNGNYTNDPIDEFNHLIDPTRYVVMHVRPHNRPAQAYDA
jgi:phage terminase large subunit